MDNEIDRKINVTAILFLLVQNRQQTHDWTLIGSDANGLGVEDTIVSVEVNISIYYSADWKIYNSDLMR